MLKYFSAISLVCLVGSPTYALPASTCNALGDLTQLVATWRDQGASYSESLSRVASEARRAGLQSSLASMVTKTAYNDFPDTSPSLLRSAIIMQCSKT